MRQNDKAASFIGSKFTTPKGTTLAVVDLLPREKYSNGKWKTIMYKVTCSECNKDKELFGDYFTSTKCKLSQGGVPCGCSSNPRYTREQYITKIVRVCNEKGYTFLGFSEWNAIRTKLSISCEEHGVWSSTVISAFLGGAGCPSCAKIKVGESHKYSADEYIDKFKGKFKEGTTFTPISKVGGVYKSWGVTCPTCSNDSYVKEGVCGGIFNSSTQSLVQGKKSCRCSKWYSYTENQRDFQVDSLMKVIGGEFKGWQDGYEGAHSKLDWYYSNGHLCTHPVGRLISSGVGCNVCSQGEFGLYKHRLQDTDYLYLMKFTSEYETFVKVGRTFNVEERLSRFRSFYTVEIISILEGKHEHTFSTEQEYHKHLQGMGLNYQPKIKFGGSTRECFLIEAEKEVIF